jgi:PPOX class probable F420-dependent enzyme
VKISAFTDKRFLVAMDGGFVPLLPLLHEVRPAPVPPRVLVARRLVGLDGVNRVQRYRVGVELPPEAKRRIAGDHVVWLTTVTDRGLPAPNPVWFVPDGEDLIVFSDPRSRKVHNIARRPTATLHFNSDPHGGDVVVIVGDVEVTHGQPPSRAPGYLEKYEADIVGPLQTTVDEIDRTYNTRLRIRPTSVRLTS